MSTLSDEDKSYLTAEEIAAIEDPEYNEQERKAIAELAAQAVDDVGQDDDQDGTEGTSQAGEKVEPMPQEGTAKPADTAMDNAPKAAAPATYQATLPDDFAAQVQAIGDKQKEVWQKFDDGDIDRDALQNELAQIEATRLELTSSRIKADISQEMTAQHAQNQWQSTIDSFMTDSAKEIDYRSDLAKQNDLDQFVKVLAANDANASKDMAWFLSEGHKRVMALHGLSAKHNQPTSRTPALKDLPISLANIPGGDAPGGVAGEFSDMDALKGDAYEAAFSRLSESQREKYMRA